MASWLRFALVWLLVAALPVQSWAAATLMNCGPTHHRMSESASHLHRVTAHAAHGHGGLQGAHEVTPHSHDGSVAAPESIAVSVAPTDAGAASSGHHDSVQKLGKFKCSACASCCMGTALPTSVLSFGASVTRDTPAAAIPQAVGVFLTSGLDRPPRTLLA